MLKINRLLNLNAALLIYFYLGWLSIAWLAKQGFNTIALIIPAGAIALSYTQWKDRALQKAMLLAIPGILFDHLAFTSGFLSFKSSEFPIWLIAVWLLFVTILPWACSQFANKTKLAFIAGALGGPLNYWIAQNMGILSIQGVAGYSIYAIFWGFFFWAAVKMINSKSFKEIT